MFRDPALFAPGSRPGRQESGLDPLTYVRLWETECWLSHRINILGNRINVPFYGWVQNTYDLTRPEFVVLNSVFLMPGTQASTISLSTGFPKNTLSRAVERLLQRSLISRSDNPIDGRSFHLHLTEHGREIVDQSLPRLYAREQHMLSSLSSGERLELSQLLAKMVAALEKAEGGEQSA